MRRTGLPVVSRGALTVDPGRAIHKLREHQLLDPKAWVLEAVRAGVAAGATRIEIDGDADDVWVSFDAAPPSERDVARLFDELVRPVADPTRRALRYLAAAVNTALALEPRWVDVYAIGETTYRARYRGGLYEDASAIAAIEPERVEQPERKVRPGVLVHVRRQLSVETALAFALGREPPELRIAREACDDVKVPIRVGPSELSPDRSPIDLVRVGLRALPALRDALDDRVDGFLGLTIPAHEGRGLGPRIEVAELGVVLVRDVMPALLARHPVEGAHPYAALLFPLRLYVDLDVVPTNASRSAFRYEPPITTVLEHATALLAIFSERVAEAYAKLEEGPKRALMRATLLQLLGSAAGRPLDPSSAHPALEPLFDLPLLRDALGRPRSVGELASSFAVSAPVHRGEESLEDELEPWLGDVPWIRPGDPAEVLLAGGLAAHAGLERTLVAVRRAARAHAAFLAHKPARPLADGFVIDLERAATDDNSWIPASTFYDCSGQVAISTAGRSGRDVSLLYEGREIERVPLRGPIAFTAQIDMPGFTPLAGYDGIVRDAAYERAIRVVRAGVVRAIERMLPDRNVSGAHYAFHRVVDCIEVAAAAVALADPPPALLAARSSPLLDVPCFEVVGSERRSDALLSLRDLRAIVAQHGAFGVIDDGTLSELPALPILRIPVYTRPTILAALPATQLVDYGLVADRDRRSPAAEVRMSGVPFLEIEIDRARIAIRPSGEWSRVVLTHFGRRLVSRAVEPTLLGYTACVDHLDAIPNADWQSAAVDPTTSIDFAPYERALVAAIAAFLGVNAAPTGFSANGASNEELAGVVLPALVRDRSLLTPDIEAALFRARLFTVLGQRSEVSLERIRELAGGEPVGWIARDDLEGPPPPVSSPVIVSPEAIVDAIAALLDLVVYDARLEIAQARVRQLGDQNLARHREQHPAPLTEALLGLSRFVVAVEGASVEAFAGLARLRNREVVVHLRVEERPFFVPLKLAGPPIDLVVEVPLSMIDAPSLTLIDRGHVLVERVLGTAIAALVREIASKQPTLLVDEEGGLALLEAFAARTSASDPFLAELVQLPIFPTVQGHRASIGGATRRSVVRVASFDGDYLGPTEHEEPDPLDRAVIKISRGEASVRLVSVIEKLAHRKTLDCTRPLLGLHAARRAKRGLVREPRLEGAPPRYKRTIAAIAGDDVRLARALPVGEVSLSDQRPGTMLLFRDGRQRIELPLPDLDACRFAVDTPLVTDAHLAAGEVDAPTKAILSLAARRGVEQLVRAILATSDGSHGRAGPLLLRAAASVGIEPSELGDALVFSTTDGQPTSFAALSSEAEHRGQVGYTLALDASGTLLDGRALVRLDLLGVRWLSGTLPLVDLTAELAQDAIARENMTRAPAGSLELSAAERDAALAVVRVHDGYRGVIAPLRPSHAQLRALRVHREMRSLGTRKDECAWPTLANVDARDLTPDRTFTGVLEDAAYRALVDDVRKRSLAATQTLFSYPRDTLVRADYGGGHDSEARCNVLGVLWLAGEPTVGSVEIETPWGSETTTMTVEVDRTPRPTPLRGRVCLTGGRQHIDALAASAYAWLARRLADAEPSDLRTAHLLAAAVLGAIDLGAHSCGRELVSCVSPATTLADLVPWLRAEEEVLVTAQRDLAERPEGRVAIDEDSATSRFVLRVLRNRARRAIDPASEMVADVKALDIADDLLRALHEAGVSERTVVGARLDARTSAPLVALDAQLLIVAGAHPAAQRAQTARSVADARYGEVLVTLTAHAISTINRALDEVTDATEIALLAALLDSGD